MTAHIIMWDEDDEPSKVDLDSAIRSLPEGMVTMGVRVLDFPDRGKVRMMIFVVPPSEPFDLDDPLICTFTPPIIHDLTYKDDLDNSNVQN